MVIECEGIKLLDCNDAKIMGLPLFHILRKHPKIDFVFRSHSPANSRLSYEFIDDNVDIEKIQKRHILMFDDATEQDSIQDRYARDFELFTRATGAKYAIPFASNHCYLHKDTFLFNSYMTTPKMVKNYFEKNNIKTPIVKVMLSGDSWSHENGFEISSNDFFDRRDEYLQEYRRTKSKTLDKFEQLESQAIVTLSMMEKYFSKFSQALPFIIRFILKNKTFTFILKSGDKQYIYEVDLYSRTVEKRDDFNDTLNPIQIHTSAYIMRDCINLNLFSHLGMSKRVKYRVTSSNKKYMDLLDFLWMSYEFEYLPINRWLDYRFIERHLLRWREFILYSQWLRDLLFLHKMNLEKYLPIRNK